MAIVENLGARYAERQGLVMRHLAFLDDPVLALVGPKDRAYPFLTLLVEHSGSGIAPILLSAERGDRWNLLDKSMVARTLPPSAD